MQNPSFTKGSDVVFDELVVGGPVKTRTVTVANNQAQGALTRGAVLGMHTDGTYARVHQTGNYGAATARAVLAKDCDPTGGNVSALVYDGGEFNEAKLNLGGTVTLANVREPLRAVGIHLKAAVPA